MRLFKRKDTGFWYVEYERNKKLSLRTKNKKEALMLFKEFQMKYYQQKLSLMKKEKTLENFFEEYLEWLYESRTEGTYKKVLTISKQFLEFNGKDKKIKEIDRKTIDKYIIYLSKRKLSAFTINGHIRHLKAAFSKAVEWEYIDKNPFNKIKLLKVEEKPPNFLTPEDIKKVLSIIDNQDLKEIFLFLIYTGVRRGESVSVKWKNVNFENNTILIEKTKTRKSRVVPLHPTLKKVLVARFRRNAPHPDEKIFNFRKDYVTKGLKKYFRLAGLNHIKVHDLRHTFASLLVMEGISLKIVKELLGHSDYKTTEIYAHVVEKTLHKAVEKLPIDKIE